MKMLPLFVAAAASLFAVTGLQAQTTTTTTTSARVRSGNISTRSSRRLDVHRRLIERTANATTPLTPRVDGSVVRAVRSGNPLQMINPFAPAEYGNGRDVTRHETDDPDQRPQGLKLFAIEF